MFGSPEWVSRIAIGHPVSQIISAMKIVLIYTTIVLLNTELGMTMCAPHCPRIFVSLDNIGLITIEKTVECLQWELLENSHH